MTTTTLEDLLKPGAFEAWLEGRKDRSVVGVRANSCACPLATYLQVSGYPEAEVYINTVRAAPGDDPIELPWRLTLFLRYVDEGVNLRKDKRIRAKAARRLLTKAEIIDQIKFSGLSYDEYVSR